MTNRARELLERALRDWDDCESILDTHTLSDAMDEIRSYLAESEVKREALSSLEIVGAYRENIWEGPFNHFKAGIRFAEKHHGIGGGE